jgi:CubicO group peptidase (beta-lactamase class C family)
MPRKLNRRNVLKTAATLAATGYLRANFVAGARARESGAPGVGSVGEIDSLLRAGTQSGEVPGIVALAATDGGIAYEGSFGRRLLPGGADMTRDSVFRIASMVKLITSVAALQLVEQGRLTLDAPAPAIEPALNAPQVFDGFNAAGIPQVRPAKGAISLRQLLTHTSGFTYRLWDAKAVRYYGALTKLPAAQRSKLPRTPLMFEPGTRWQYGPSIDWVGRIVEQVSGDPIDVYFRKHILDPLSMNDTAFVISPEQQKREARVHRREGDGSLLALPLEQQTGRGNFTGGGGIYSTAPDYLTLIRALMQGGALNGVRILNPQSVALMGQNQIGAVEVGVLRTTVPALSNDVDFFPGIACKWGLGHMLTTQPVAGGRSAGSMTWAGLYNTYYWIDPVKRVAAVFMTQVLPFADQRALRLYWQFERGLYAALKTG